MEAADRARKWLEVWAAAPARQAEAAAQKQTLWTNLNQAASEGNPQAEFQIGDLYDRGWVVALDRRQAAEHYLRAAACHAGLAEYRLGAYHETGTVYPPSWQEAADWYRRSANDGIADGYGSLALIAFNGHLGARNIGEAIRLFAAAGELGSRADRYQALALWKNPNIQTNDQLDNAAAALVNGDDAKIGKMGWIAGQGGYAHRIQETDLHCGLPQIGYYRECFANERPH
jgi:TPR repeat protein